MKRTIISINEELCDGCGLCASGCPEGALRIVDGKARLVGDLLCDGLGACIGTCPKGAITVVEREAAPYDERKVMEENIIPKGQATIQAHLEHLRHHGEEGYLKIATEVLAEKGLAWNPPKNETVEKKNQRTQTTEGVSELRQWPVQLHLINPRAPRFNGAKVLLAADCTAYAAGDFHRRWLSGMALAIACPKLDDGMDRYLDKLVTMMDESLIESLMVLRMSVPCCGGLVRLAMAAREKASRQVPIYAITIDPEGEVLDEQAL